MSKKKRTVVYTVSSVDVETDSPVQHEVVEFFENRRDAVAGCVNYILERIGIRADIRYALFHDVNHPGMFARVKKIVPGTSLRNLHWLFAYRIDDGWSMRPEVEDALRRILSDEISFGSVYEIVTDTYSEIGAETFEFCVTEVNRGKS